MSTPLYTPRGLRKALNKIEEIKGELAAHKLRMGDAIEHGASGGDSWHDNAAFDAVTNDMRMTNHRLFELMTAVNADKDVVFRPTRAIQINIGIKANVVLDKEPMTISVGGFGESDIDEDIISYNTPLGQALLGMKPGEKKEVPINGRRRSIEVLEISVDDRFWTT